MIKFDLICENQHIFEASFDDSNSFEKQKRKKQIECPFCNSSKISKSANISKKRPGKMAREACHFVDEAVFGDVSNFLCFWYIFSTDVAKMCPSTEWLMDKSLEHWLNIFIKNIKQKHLQKKAGKHGARSAPFC